MKTVCLIGGGGFLGTPLRETLAAHGYRLVTVGRTPRLAIRPDEEYFSLSLSSLGALERRLRDRQVHAVIDLSHNSVPNAAPDPVEDVAQNVRNAIQHLDFALEVKSTTFAYISSGGTVYGDGARTPCTELATTDPISPYGIAKLASEKFVLAHQRRHGMRTLILRPSNVYGPGQIPFRGQGLVATALGLAWKNQPIRVFGAGAHVRDYLYIDDFCSAVLGLIGHESADGIYNLGSGMGVSIRDLLGQIAAVVARDGRALQCKQMPERPFDVTYSVLDVGKLRAATGWKPRIDLPTGITRTWDWIQRRMEQSGERA